MESAFFHYSENVQNKYQDGDAALPRSLPSVKPVLTLPFPTSNKSEKLLWIWAPPPLRHKSSYKYLHIPDDRFWSRSQIHYICKPQVPSVAFKAALMM